MLRLRIRLKLLVYNIFSGVQTFFAYYYSLGTPRARITNWCIHTRSLLRSFRRKPSSYDLLLLERLRFLIDVEFVSYLQILIALRLFLLLLLLTGTTQ